MLNIHGSFPRLSADVMGTMRTNDADNYNAESDYVTLFMSPKFTSLYGTVIISSYLALKTPVQWKQRTTNCYQTY